MNSHRQWILVLAAGAGQRLSGITRQADGRAVPKQYCSLGDGPSLLLETIARARRLAPAQRVLVVVAEEHAAWWRPQLANVAAENILVQPRNCGTATGMLLGLAAVQRRDAGGWLAVMPSDHYVDRPVTLLASLQRALHRSALDRGSVYLLGITPDAPETEYGWIVPGPAERGVCSVQRFVEKPDAAAAASLLAAGAVWHSFLVAGAVRTLWNLCARRAPLAAQALAAAFARPPAERAAAVTAAYAELPTVDFARDVLPGAEAQLRLLVAPACGWTDLGTPRRLLEVVRRRELRAEPAPGPRLVAVGAPVVDLARAIRADGASVGI